MTSVDNAVLAKKERDLIKSLSKFHNLGVAFSGGVDSTVLLYAAKEAMAGGVIAFTARSVVHPSEELVSAIALAEQIGVRQVFFDSDEMEVHEFTKNPQNRCYICKKRLFALMADHAATIGIDNLAHGANVDDLSDFRPGIKAAQEMGIAAPLIDAGLSKADIRSLAKHWGLSNWNKPAMACLVTRIPYNVSIDHPTLTRIDTVETFLRKLGVTQCRVRHHDNLARIETDEMGMALLSNSETRLSVVKFFREHGYTFVCLDLEGYLSGKMNYEVNF